ncbi:hypothetical protein OTU49_001937 [Cherax quadricarinatus]|uniref:C-type lectin domain-containing protein n=2 Tax=Cherax quadricarinatus TaxID=27406 RepID=A0AAW0XQ35_CHEQU|nr:uncharacterized protein LOC128693349 isoform X2 [Cherax quadricarinatus]
MKALINLPTLPDSTNLYQPHPLSQSSYPLPQPPHHHLSQPSYHLPQSSYLWLQPKYSLPQLPHSTNTLLHSPLVLASLLLLIGSSKRAPSTSWSSLAHDDHLQALLSHNLDAVHVINYNLSSTLQQRRQTGSFVEKERQGCRSRLVREAPQTLSSGFLPLQESIVALQEALVRRHIRKQPTQAVDEVLRSLSMELERQRTRLEKLKGKKEGSSSHPITDKKPCSQKIRYWLGASDEALEGEWRWVTGGTVVADWRPDNVSRQGEVQDCLTLLLSKHRPPSLDDYSCWKKRNFICQLDIHC